MTDTIIIGPVEGLSAEQSIFFIEQNILVEHKNKLEELADRGKINRRSGEYLIPMKPHKVDYIDDLFIPIAAEAKKIADKLGKKIPCGKIDRERDLDDDEGNVPDTPVVGPRGGLPTLSGYAVLPESEFLMEANLSGEGWKGKTNRNGEKTAAERLLTQMAVRAR